MYDSNTERLSISPWRKGLTGKATPPLAFLSAAETTGVSNCAPHTHTHTHTHGASHAHGQHGDARVHRHERAAANSSKPARATEDSDSWPPTRTSSMHSWPSTRTPASRARTTRRHHTRARTRQHLKPREIVRHRGIEVLRRHGRDVVWQVGRAQRCVRRPQRPLHRVAPRSAPTQHLAPHDRTASLHLLTRIHCLQACRHLPASSARSQRCGQVCRGVCMVRGRGRVKAPSSWR